MGYLGVCEQTLELFGLECGKEVGGRTHETVPGRRKCVEEAIVGSSDWMVMVRYVNGHFGDLGYVQKTNEQKTMMAIGIGAGNGIKSNGDEERQKVVRVYMYFACVFINGLTGLFEWRIYLILICNTIIYVD